METTIRAGRAGLCRGREQLMRGSLVRTTFLAAALDVGVVITLPGTARPAFPGAVLGAGRDRGARTLLLESGHDLSPA